MELLTYIREINIVKTVDIVFSVHFVMHGMMYQMMYQYLFLMTKFSNTDSFT